MSTAFSGVDAPAVALLQLAYECGVTHKSCIKHLHTIEISQHCRTQLDQHPIPAVCSFGDILDFVAPYLRLKIPSLLECGKISAVLEPLLELDGAIEWYYPYPFCLVPGK